MKTIGRTLGLTLAVFCNIGCSDEPETPSSFDGEQTPATGGQSTTFVPKVTTGGSASTGGSTSAGTGGDETASTGGSDTLGTGGVVMDPEPPRMRVVGYLPNWYDNYSNWASKVDFDKVTHINMAFALGTEDGHIGLANGNDIDTFVAAAHAKGVKVFPSLCGGGGDPTITPHYEPGEVDAFVKNIVDFAVAHDFDGIDVDVEAPNKMGSKYDTFISKLKAKADEHDMEITAAVAQWMQWGMSDDTLRSFDFITVMSYDNCGTWTDACEHSSYKQAQDAITFYKNKGLSNDQIVLGVPFYGYCWGNCNGKSKDYVLYKDILSRNADAWTTDWFTQNGATYSYNGIDTMQKKVALGGEYGGIMIWELAGDVSSDKSTSLLKAIDDAQ